MGMRSSGDLGRLIDTSTGGCPAEVAGGGCVSIDRDYLNELFPPGVAGLNGGWRRVWRR